MFCCLPGDGSSSCRFRKTKLKWMQQLVRWSLCWGHAYVAQRKECSRTSVNNVKLSLWFMNEFWFFKIQLENLWTSMEFSEAYSAYSENFLIYLFCGDHFTEFRLWGIIGRFQYFIKRDSVEAEAKTLWQLADLKPALGIWKFGVQLRTAGTNTLESVRKKLSNVTFFMVYSEIYTYFYIPWKSKPTTIKSIMAWNCWL